MIWGYQPDTESYGPQFAMEAMAPWNSIGWSSDDWTRTPLASKKRSLGESNHGFRENSEVVIFF